VAEETAFELTGDRHFSSNRFSENSPKRTCP
jgi:hypothetical protein